MLLSLALCSISMLWTLRKLLVILAMTMPMKGNQKTLKQEFTKKMLFIFLQFLNLLEDFQETSQYFFLN